MLNAISFTDNFILSLASEELVILGSVLAAIVGLTAVFVARELKKSKGEAEND